MSAVQDAIINTWFRPCLNAGLSIFKPAVWPKQVISEQNCIWYGVRNGQPVSKEEKEELDRSLKQQFEVHLQAANEGKLESWTKEPKGLLALIILCDQFSRNIYRGTGKAFAMDSYAQKLAQQGIEREVNKNFESFLVRQFFYLPLMHAEDKTLQEKCVAIYEEEYSDAKRQELPKDYLDFLQYCLGFAKEHKDVVDQFGRFPTRNKILGRTSTAEELEFLKSASSWGQ